MPLSEEKFVDVQGIRTRYFDQGQGEAILLLHGSFFGETFSSDCSANWSENFQGLAEFARVVAVDRLGQGYTDNPKRIEDYTMKAVGEHVRQFVRKLDLGPVHIVGHSRGGYVACRATLDYPEMIKTCVIIDSGTLAPGTTPMHEIMVDAPKPGLTKDLSAGYCGVIRSAMSTSQTNGSVRSRPLLPRTNIKKQRLTLRCRPMQRISSAKSLKPLS